MIADAKDKRISLPEGDDVENHVIMHKPKPAQKPAAKKPKTSKKPPAKVEEEIEDGEEIEEEEEHPPAPKPSAKQQSTVAKKPPPVVEEEDEEEEDDGMYLYRVVYRYNIFKVSQYFYRYIFKKSIDIICFPFYVVSSSLSHKV